MSVATSSGGSISPDGKGWGMTDEIVVYDGVRTLVDVVSNFPPARTVPAGTEGTVVECYRDPEGYVVDLSIPDDSVVGGVDFDTATLRRDQFELVSKGARE